MKPRKYFVGGDAHARLVGNKISGVDLLTNNAVVTYLEQESPWDGYINLGDLFDFNVISSHNKGNLRAVRGEDIAGQYKVGNAYLAQHYDAAGRPEEFYLIEGNHEYRVERYINANPELEGFVEVAKNLPSFVKWVPFWSKHRILTVGKASFIHGLYHGRNHALQHLQDYGCNIFYGHCVSADTEVLTDSGWKSYDEVKDLQHRVVTLNLKTKTLEYQYPTAHFKYVADKYPTMISFKNQYTDILVTGEHGMVGESGMGYTLGTAEEFSRTSFQLPVAGNHSGLGLGLSDDEIRLIVWICTDGSFENVKFPGYAVRFHLKKERKIARLENLLQRLDVAYNKKVQQGGTTKLYVKLPGYLSFYIEKTNKRLPQVFRYLSKAQSDVFFEEIVHTDGCRSGTAIQYSSSKEDEADLVQEIAVLNGRRASKIAREGSTGLPNFVVSINEIHSSAPVEERHATVVPNNSYVWCLSVPNGTLLFRRNGKVFITQNTHSVESAALRYHGKDRTKVAQSMGLLGSYDQSYMRGRPSKWQQAFGVFYFWPDGNFNYYVVDIFNHKFISPSGNFYDGNKIRPETGLILVP